MQAPGHRLLRPSCGPTGRCLLTSPTASPVCSSPISTSLQPPASSLRATNPSNPTRPATCPQRVTLDRKKSENHILRLNADSIQPAEHLGSDLPPARPGVLAL